MCKQSSDVHLWMSWLVDYRIHEQASDAHVVGCVSASVLARLDLIKHSWQATIVDNNTCPSTTPTQNERSSPLHKAAHPSRSSGGLSSS